MNIKICAKKEFLMYRLSFDSSFLFSNQKKNLQICIFYIFFNCYYYHIIATIYQIYQNNFIGFRSQVIAYRFRTIVIYRWFCSGNLHLSSL